MNIFYTGAKEYNDAQVSKDKSLGGFKSSTLIPNDLSGNLFGDTSMLTLDQKLRETRAIIIHNNGGAPLVNLYLHFDKLLGSIGKFEVASIALAPDADNEVSMESISSIRATPFVGNFVEADTVANKVLLSSSFASDAYIGLWIRRVIEDSDKDQFDCDTMYDDFIAEPQVPQVTSGNVDITLAWD